MLEKQIEINRNVVELQRVMLEYGKGRDDTKEHQLQDVNNYIIGEIIVNFTRERIV